MSFCRDENHLTPLLLAARLDRCQTITMLLDYGAKIGGVSKNKVKQTFVVIIATFSARLTDINSHPLHYMPYDVLPSGDGDISFFPRMLLRVV